MSGIRLDSDLVRSLAGCFLAVALVVMLPSEAHAGRVGWIYIGVDGKTWLTSSTFDDGSDPPAAVWRQLIDRGLDRASGVRIAPDPANPLRATLRGNVTIDVRYGGKAEVEELRLVRKTRGGRWMVDRDDVERIAKEIGLGSSDGGFDDPAPEGA